MKRKFVTSSTFTVNQDPNLGIKFNIGFATQSIGIPYPPYPDVNSRYYYVERAITFGPFEKIPDDIVFDVSTDEHRDIASIDARGLELAADYAVPLGEGFYNSQLEKRVRADNILLQLAAQRFSDGIYLVLEIMRLADELGLEEPPSFDVDDGQEKFNTWCATIGKYLDSLGACRRRDYTHLDKLEGDRIALAYHGQHLTITQTLANAISTQKTISLD